MAQRMRKCAALGFACRGKGHGRGEPTRDLGGEAWPGEHRGLHLRQHFGNDLGKQLPCRLLESLAPITRG